MDQTIKYIKIFGERNSGTNYLEKIISQNCNDIKILGSLKGGWKHGFPNLESFAIDNNETFNYKNTLFIFIIRDLQSWIVSMYNRPYHINKKSKNINDFLNEKWKPNDNKYNQMHSLMEDTREHNTILNIRYDKLNAYRYFFNKILYGSFLHLDFLQNKPKLFLDNIQNKYSISVSNSFNNYISHTKTGKQEKNTKYDNKLSKFPYNKFIEFQVQQLLNYPIFKNNNNNNNNNNLI